MRTTCFLLYAIKPIFSSYQGQQSYSYPVYCNGSESLQIQTLPTSSNSKEVFISKAAHMKDGNPITTSYIQCVGNIKGHGISDAINFHVVNCHTSSNSDKMNGVSIPLSNASNGQCEVSTSSLPGVFGDIPILDGKVDLDLSGSFEDIPNLDGEVALDLGGSFEDIPNLDGGKVGSNMSESIEKLPRNNSLCLNPFTSNPNCVNEVNNNDLNISPSLNTFLGGIMAFKRKATDFRARKIFSEPYIYPEDSFFPFIGMKENYKEFILKKLKNSKYSISELQNVVFFSDVVLGDISLFHIISRFLDTESRFDETKGVYHYQLEILNFFKRPYDFSNRAELESLYFQLFASILFDYELLYSLDVEADVAYPLTINFYPYTSVSKEPGSFVPIRFNLSTDGNFYILCDSEFRLRLAMVRFLGALRCKKINRITLVRLDTFIRAHYSN